MTAIPTRYMTTLPHINSLKRLNKLKYLGLQDILPRGMMSTDEDDTAEK